MSEGLSRTPGQARALQGGMQVGERGRGQVVKVVGEQSLGVSITLHRSGTGVVQQVCRKADGTTDHGQGPGPLLVDIGGQQPPQALVHLIGRCPSGLDNLFRRDDPPWRRPLGHAPFHPPGEGSHHPDDQRLGQLG